MSSTVPKGQGEPHKSSKNSGSSSRSNQNRADLGSNRSEKSRGRSTSRDSEKNKAVKARDEKRRLAKYGAKDPNESKNQDSSKSTPATKQKNEEVISPTGFTPENKAINTGTCTFTNFLKLQLSPSQKFCDSFFEKGFCADLNGHDKDTSTEVSMDSQLSYPDNLNCLKTASKLEQNKLSENDPEFCDRKSESDFGDMTGNSKAFSKEKSLDSQLPAKLNQSNTPEIDLEFYHNVPSRSVILSSVTPIDSQYHKTKHFEKLDHKVCNRFCDSVTDYGDAISTETSLDSQLPAKPNQSNYPKIGSELS